MEESPAPPQVSVLIVSHNDAASLRRCLEALHRSAGRERFEVLVVDAGSRDESPNLDVEFPWAIFLRLPRNFGFTKALNIGMRTAKGEYVLFLDQRAEVAPDAVSRMAAALAESSDVVAVTPLLTGPDGEPLPQLHKLPVPATMSALSRIPGWDAFAPAESQSDSTPVEFPGLEAAMVRLWFVKGLRYIDERYGQSWADAEVFYQIRRAGKKVLLLPEVRVVFHGEPGIPAAQDPRWRALISADWVAGAATFASKHFGGFFGMKLRLGAIMGAFGRLLLGIFSPGEFRYRLNRFLFLVMGQKIDGTQNI